MYSILDDTFCVYCQVDFKTSVGLQQHVTKDHPDSIAADSIKAAQRRLSRESHGNPNTR